MAREHIVTVVLDTNLFVAAYWNKRSASAKLIQACIDGKANAQYTQEVKKEVIYTLRHMRAKETYIQQLETFWNNAQEVQPKEVHVKTADPDDQKFLEAAAGGNSDFIVTNDDHLLSVGYIGRTEILSPSSLAKLIGV